MTGWEKITDGLNLIKTWVHHSEKLRWQVGGRFHFTQHMFLNDSLILKKFLYLRDKAKNQYWMAVGHQCIENRHHSVFSGLLQGLTSTSFPEPLPGIQFHCIHKCQLKRYRAKSKAYIFNPETLLTSLGLSSFKKGQRSIALWCWGGTLVHKASRLTGIFGKALGILNNKEELQQRLQVKNS